MGERLHGLLSARAWPAWAVLVWNAAGAMSRIEYIGKKMDLLWSFAQSPVGNIVLLVIAVTWLTLVVVWPRKADRRAPSPIQVAEAASQSTPVQINAAEYGSDRYRVDVTGKLRSMAADPQFLLQDGSIGIPATNEIVTGGADLDPGVPKYLFVSCSLRIPEGKHLLFPK